MNDFESRLHETLADRAGQAPDALGLAADARRRLRRRRTGWTVGVVAVVALAIPVGFSQIGGLGSADSDRGTNVANSGGPDAPQPVADGFRYETWHGVTVQVPTDWGHGASSSWCANGEEPGDVTPFVARPGTVGFSIGCNPVNGYGVTLGSSAFVDPAYASGHVWQFESDDANRPLYPEGAWMGYWYDADELVTVVTPDRGLTQQIIDSATKVDGVDPNGCPVRWVEPEARAGVSLCRYFDDDLVASRLLVDEQATAAVETLISGPVRAKADRCIAPEFNEMAGFHDRTIAYQGGDMVALAFFGECEGVIVADSTRSQGNLIRKVTDDVRALIDQLG